jgi:hypothetical protein
MAYFKVYSTGCAEEHHGKQSLKAGGLGAEKIV